MEGTRPPLTKHEQVGSHAIVLAVAAAAYDPKRSVRRENPVSGP
jgi:hypothetical protein